MAIELKSGESYKCTSDGYAYPNFKIHLHLADGTLQEVEFVGGIFVTTDSDLATALDKEVKARGCTALTGGEVVKTETLDPLFALRAKIRAEMEAEHLANAQKGSSYSATGLPGAGMVSTADNPQAAVAKALAENAALKAEKAAAEAGAKAASVAKTVR